MHEPGTIWPRGSWGHLWPLAARVMAARCGVLRAEHVYAFVVGDLRRHCHLHLAPRFPHTPERLRDRRCFESRPEDMLPERVVISAAARVAAMVRAAAP